MIKMSKQSKKITHSIPIKAKKPILPINKPSGSSPHWLFQRMDWDGAFSWNNCENFGEVLKKLGELEKLPWVELRSKGSHNSDIEIFSQEAKSRLADLKLDDHDEFYSFRLNGKIRVWALQHGSCMLLLWWDPDHKVYPVEKKKHT